MKWQTRNAKAVAVITGHRLGQPPLLPEAPGLLRRGLRLQLHLQAKPAQRHYRENQLPGLWVR